MFIPELSATGTAIGATIIVLGNLFFSIRFRHLQNRNTASGKWVGGEISWPKAFWLGYTLANWFLLPWIFVFNPELSAPLRWVILGHLASWWIRGILELFMIYRWYNWTPIYGISHDLIHNFALIGGISWAMTQDPTALANPESLGFWAWLYLFVTTFALMGEILFAALFFTTRGKGEGAEKIYFASDSPEYRLINGFTRAVCTVVYVHMAIQLVGLWWRAL